MDEDTISTLFILGLIAFIVIIVASIKSDKKHKEERKNVLDKEISKLPNKNSLKKVFGTKNQYAFILDDVGKMIYYMDFIHTHKISFDKIISVELLEDSSVLSSKSTTRTLGGALLGGALAGGAGMVVGGLSGNSKQKKKVSKVSVKIKVRDYSTPSLQITCFDAPILTGSKEIKTTDSIYGQIYRDELQNAQKIADYVSVIIDEVDREERQVQNSIQDTPKISSVADELTKLAALKEQGVLTDEEFQSQKQKLLNK